MPYDRTFFSLNPPLFSLRRWWLVPLLALVAMWNWPRQPPSSTEVTREAQTLAEAPSAFGAPFAVRGPSAVLSDSPRQRGGGLDGWRLRNRCWVGSAPARPHASPSLDTLLRGWQPQWQKYLIDNIKPIHKALGTGEHTYFGGVGLNKVIHGNTGIGTPLEPKLLAYVAMWGKADLKDGNGNILTRDHL